MKARILVFCVLVAAATSVRADSVSYAQCGTYDAYLLVYKSTERFEELGKLRCGEKVEVLSRSGSYSQIRTVDGRLGWVRSADLSDTPPPPQRTFTFGLSEVAKPATVVADRPSVAPEPLVSTLKNADILAMHKQHPGSDFILKQIGSSRCAFDTSTEALQKLKASGLSDKVILAMLEAPVAPVAADRSSAETVQVKVPDGAAIEVELSGNVSSEEALDGAVVEMSAAEDLVVDGVPIVVRGSTARARILAVKEPGAHGGSGEVAWFMQDIVATTGDRIPVTFAAKQPDNKRTRSFEGYPFFVSEFRKGSPAIKATDKRFRVVIHGDTVLNVNQSLTAGLPAPTKPKTQSVRQVSTQLPIHVEPVAPAQMTEADEAKP
ncbi:MAG: SH3 domain-containing protein [Candidatus Acidiferrales bacterium]